MNLVTWCFIAGMVFLIAAAKMNHSEEAEELEEERETREWINYLADSSKRPGYNPRRRYSVSGAKIGK